jgi:hypothetical protein
MPNATNERMKMVEVATKMEKIAGNRTRHRVKERTAGGLQRAAKVLRAVDAFCDGLKAKETDRSIRLQGPTGLCTALRNAVRNS